MGSAASVCHRRDLCEDIPQATIPRTMPFSYRLAAEADLAALQSSDMTNWHAAFRMPSVVEQFLHTKVWTTNDLGSI